MDTVRITANLHVLQKMEWVGAPAIDVSDHIERSVDLPEDIFEAIERSIAQGNLEGIIFRPGGQRVEWFLDRARKRQGKKRG